MRTKNIGRKLFLNKKTIADLSGGQMEHLKAGFVEIPDHCQITEARSGCPTGITCVTVCSCPSACSLGGNCC